MRAHWSTFYLGIPYRDRGRDRRGVDCWGLAVLVYAEQLGIALPSHDERSAAGGSLERRLIADMIDRERTGKDWTQVERPGPFDLMVFSAGGPDRHLAIALGPDRMDRMLHVEDDGDTVRVECWRTSRWDRSLIGIYRHAAKAVVS